jgi:hypothetical protein
MEQAMKLKAISIAAGAVAGIALAMPQAASASLVYDSSLLASAQGFGNSPRDLTLQATGQADTFESGAVGVGAGGGITFGSPILDATVHDANGVQTQSGTDDLPQPLADDQKYGIPTTGSLGITSADQIGVLFNATEPGGDAVNVVDVTLKFYSSTGTFLGAIDGSQDFPNSNPGNGVAGFTFVVSPDERTYVNGLLATGGSGTRMALESTITGFGGGPESYLIYNVAAIPEPETYALMLAGLGAMGFIAKRRRKA